VAQQFPVDHLQEKEVRTGKTMIQFMQMKDSRFLKKRLKES
jgi:hypothetical protein